MGLLDRPAVRRTASGRHFLEVLMQRRQNQAEPSIERESTLSPSPFRDIGRRGPQAQILAEEGRLDRAESRMQRRAARAHRRAAALALAVGSAAFCAGGCFSERSFVVPDAQMVPAKTIAGDAGHTSARHWTEHAAVAMSCNFPADRRTVLTETAACDASGKPVDAWRVFGINPTALDKLLGNLTGLQETAKVSPPGNRDGDAERWPGFTCREIPMSDGLRIYARMAPPLEAEDNDDGSYIVVTHGLFSNQQGYEARNVAEALRRFGHHVVAIEMRGHGETGRLNPRYPTTFGASEVRDLIEVARWLRDTRGAKRVGLLCFSITAQEGMTAAWADSDAIYEEAPSPMINGLPRPRSRPAYDAIVAVCPPLNLVDYADSLERRYTMLQSPVRATFQQRIAARMIAAGAKPTWSMWEYARFELSRTRWAAQYPNTEAMRDDLLRLVDFRGGRGGDWRIGASRLERVRTPLLVVATANDPLGSTQATVDLIARVRNPNVGLLVLRRGGHTGLSAAGAACYHSMLRAAFDPVCCPTAATLLARQPTTAPTVVTMAGGN